MARIDVINNYHIVHKCRVLATVGLFAPFKCKPRFPLYIDDGTDNSVFVGDKTN